MRNSGDQASHEEKSLFLREWYLRETWLGVVFIQNLHMCVRLVGRVCLDHAGEVRERWQIRAREEEGEQAHHLFARVKLAAMDTHFPSFLRTLGIGVALRSS